MNRWKGFTVVELLIAFALSMMLLVTVTQLIIDEKTQYAKQQQLLDVQEGAQAATLIFHDIVDAMQSSVNVGCHPALWVNHTDGRYFQWLSRGNQWAINKNNNFIVQHWKTPLTLLSQPMVSLSQLAVDKANFFIKKNRPVVITDCQLAEVATVISVHHKQEKTILTLKEPLSQRYGGNTKQSWVTPLLQDTYYVNRTSRCNKAGQPINALYVKDIAHDVYELIPGIMSLSIYQQDDKKALTIQMNIASLEAIKNSKPFSFSNRLPLWLAQGRLHLQWHIILRGNYG
ncbi:MAG: PilW family protein [Gammaproteobacteria bacterium]